MKIEILHWIFGNKSLWSWYSWLVKKIWSIPTYEKNHAGTDPSQLIKQRCSEVLTYLVMRRRCYLSSILSSICAWREMHPVALLKLFNDLSDNRGYPHYGPPSAIQHLPSTIWSYHDNHICNYIISVRYLLFFIWSSERRQKSNVASHWILKTAPLYS